MSETFRTFISRFEGEDAIFTCGITKSDSFRVTSFDVYWTFNGNIIKNNKRHKFSSYEERYNFVYHLVIKNIKYTDYGQYRCLVRLTSSNGHNTPEITDTKEIKMIYLTRLSERFMSIRATTGTAINIENMFILRNLRNYKNRSQHSLNWVYKINDAHISKLCEVPVSRHIPTHHQMKYKSPSCSVTKREYACNFSLCVCVKAFGVHEFATVITDEVGNSKVINHPLKFLLLAKETNKFLSGPVYYNIYNQIEAELRQKGSSITHTSIFGMLQVKELAEFRKFEFVVLVFHFLFVSSLVGLLRWLDNFCFILNTYVILPFQQPEYRLGFIGQQRRLQKAYEFDVFLSFL